ncbi:MAG: N-acetyltransferase family protein [Gemmatimonadota bacterium]
MSGGGDLSATAIRPMTPDDWPEVSRIYAEGIATGTATFEAKVPSWADWDAGHLRYSRLVAERSSALLGWAALSPVSRRACYAGVAEISVYVAERARGGGIGRRLLEGLVESAESSGIWTLQAGVFAENAASLRLHQVCGFRLVGRRERIAQLGGRWRDTILLERRSLTVAAVSDSEEGGV